MAIIGMGRPLILPPLRRNEDRRAPPGGQGGGTAIAAEPAWLGLVKFFMADVQTGFGSFVSFYLADQGWSEENVGFVPTAGALSDVVGQVPGGALVDAMRRKRLLIGVGTLMIVASAVLLALSRDFPAVFAAEVLHGATSAIIGPAIAAVSLGLVGRRAMSGRIGRNQRFNAAGNALTAALLGVIGSYVSKSAIFFAVAAMTLPTLATLGRIRSREIAYGRARNAAGRHEPRRSAANFRPAKEPPPSDLRRSGDAVPFRRCVNAAAGERKPWQWPRALLPGSSWRQSSWCRRSSSPSRRRGWVITPSNGAANRCC